MTSTVAELDSDIDEARVGAFAERLFTTYTEAMVTLMIDLGSPHRPAGDTGRRRRHQHRARRARRAHRALRPRVPRRAGHRRHRRVLPRRAPLRPARRARALPDRLGVAEPRADQPVEHAARRPRPGGEPGLPRGRRGSVRGVPSGVHRRHGRRVARLPGRAAGRRPPAAHRRPAGPPAPRDPGGRHRLRHRPRDQPARPGVPRVVVHRVRHRGRRDRACPRRGRAVGAAERVVRRPGRRHAAHRPAVRRGVRLRRDPRPGGSGRRAPPRARRPRAGRRLRHVRHQGGHRSRGQHRQPVRAVPLRREHAALHDGLAGRRRGGARHGLGRGAGPGRCWPTPGSPG